MKVAAKEVRFKYGLGAQFIETLRLFTHLD
jgi:hypothetical protein